MDEHPDLASFTASLLPVLERDANPEDPAQIEAAALLRCATVLLERRRMLATECRRIDAELYGIGARLHRPPAAAVRR
jgi:hypothetical protein